MSCVPSAREAAARVASLGRQVAAAACSCAEDTTAVPLHISSATPKVHARCLVFIGTHGIATAAASAPAWAICAIAAMFFQVLPPKTAFSGTTTMSPGPIWDESTPPDHKPPCRPLVTDPSSPLIKIPPLLASWVGPPARERYQPAFLPGVYVSALAL